MSAIFSKTCFLQYDFKALSTYLFQRVKENLFVVSPMTRVNLRIRVFPNNLSPLIEELKHPKTAWKNWVMMWHKEMPFLCPDGQTYSQKTIPVRFKISDSCYPNRALQYLANYAFEKLSSRSLKAHR